MQFNTRAHTNKAVSLTYAGNLQLCSVMAYARWTQHVTFHYTKSSFMGIPFLYLLVFDMHDLALGIFVLIKGHQDSVGDIHWIN